MPLFLKHNMTLTNKLLGRETQDVNEKIPNTSGLVNKTHLSTKIIAIANKILNTTGLVTTVALKTKVTEIENKIPDISNLATKASLNTKATTIEKKIPNINSFITAPEFNRLTKISFDTRMKETKKSLARKTEVIESTRFRR